MVLQLSCTAPLIAERFLPPEVLSIWSCRLTKLSGALLAPDVVADVAVMPCLKTALTFLFTVSSVSPNSSRRSLWPTITYSTSSLGRKAADTSPVNAPFSSQWQFWAPTMMSHFFWSISVVCTERMSVNGGCTEMSTLA